MYGRRVKKHPRFGGTPAPKPPLARVWAARTRPHTTRLWQLLELDNLTGERREMTYHILKEEVLPICVTRDETHKMKAWIDDLEREAASQGLAIEGVPIKRSTFHARLHKDMFAPLLEQVVNESDMDGLRSTFVDVISSVERKRRWQKLENRFRIQPESCSRRAQGASKDADFLSGRNINTNISSSTSNKNAGFDARSKKSSSSNFSFSKATISSANLKSQKQNVEQTPYEGKQAQHRPAPPCSSFSSSSSSQHRNLRRSFVAADSLRSVVRIWTYNRDSNQSEVSTLHDGDHIASASMHNNQVSMLFSDGKMKESSLRPRRDAEADSNDHVNNTSKSEITAAMSSHLPSSSSSSSSSCSSSLSISASALYGHRVQSLSASDTQAAIVVEGRLYTWGHTPEVLGHPPLPKQNDAMITPEVSDIIRGSRDEDDFLQKTVFNAQLSEYSRWHELTCQRSSLAASLSKEGASSKATADPDTAEAMKTWLEFPHQADELWKKLQAEWHKRLCQAGPRLVLAVEDQNIHHVRMVAVGSSHAIASTESGRLIVWGINHHGCLGLGNRVAEGALQRLPVELFLTDSLESIDEDEKHTGRNAEPKFKYDNRSKKVRELAEAKKRKKREARAAHLSSGIAKIGCGGGHSAILMGDGSVYTWGSGHFGQLGHRDFDDQSTPTRISLAPDHIYKKSPDRRGRIAARATRHGRTSPPPSHAAGGAINVQDVQQSHEASQCSPASKERSRRSEETWAVIPFADIALGRDHTLALTRDGTVYTFGGNWRGQLGRHTKLHHSTVGKNHKHMLVINSLKANWSVQRAVSKLAIKARGLTKMRDSYPKSVDLRYYGQPDAGRLTRGKVVSISAHEHASAVLRDDGVVFSWGRVAVPRHAFEAENDPFVAQQLRDGVVDTTVAILSDRSYPIANDMLRRPGYLPRKVGVAETSIMVIFDREEHAEKTRRGKTSNQMIQMMRKKKNTSGKK